MSEQEFRREAEMREPVLMWLRVQGYLSAVEMSLYHRVDIVAGMYGRRPTPGRKPPLLVCAAVELKLSDVAGAMAQAEENQYHAHLTYCAFPLARTEIMTARTMERFRHKGIGLLVVTTGAVCETVCAARQHREINPVIVRRLWPRVRQQYIDNENRGQP